MNIYMYDHVPNFGDVLNRYIWPHYLGPLLEHQDDILMLGIGTILGQKFTHTGRYIVCGSGCGYGAHLEEAKDGRWTFYFVRGPLTARTFGLPEALAVTDPAILTPDIFKAASPSGKTVFVPHWETAHNPLWRKACELADIDYVDPLGPVSQVCAGISGARLVITEAMHGAILADSYRVPWLPVTTSGRINRFKWMDWLLSMNIHTEFQALEPLGWSDRFRSIELSPNEPVTGQHDGLSKAPAPNSLSLKRALMNSLSSESKNRMKSQLFLKVGPYLDRVSYKLASSHAEKLIARSAKELSNVGKLSGWLSDEKTYRLKSQTVRRKIIEVNEGLLSQLVA